MRLANLIHAVLLAVGTTVQAASAEAALKTLRTLDDVRDWQAVGRLDVADRAFCTGALIAPDLVLTAAHCMYHPVTGRPVAARDLKFRAGYRGGRADAERVAVAYVAHPGFDIEGPDTSDRIAADLALVRLARPVPDRIAPFETASRPRKGAEVGVVSYGGSRADSPSLQETCHVLARRRGMLMMNCQVEQGSSGAPVFVVGPDGRAQIVSVISSFTEIRGRPAALGTDLEKPLAVVHDLLVTAPVSVPASNGPVIRRLAAPAVPGAKFVRP